MDLANSIDLRFEDYKNNSYLTHNFHPYPAKFVPQIPAELIRTLSKPGDWILDPFAGSGTTLVEAKLAGRHAIGTDINPLSCLVSKVKTSFLTEPESIRAKAIIARAVEEVRTEIRHNPPRFFGLDKWFSSQAQIELAAILSVIHRTRSSTNVQDFLKVAFSAIVVRASNQDSDTRYKAVQKNIPKHGIGDMFAARASDMLHRMDQFRAVARSTECSVYVEDSTEHLPGNKLFQLALTSPPYMNSYDYYLYHKHRMNWLGLDYRNAQEVEFGSRNKHNDQKLGIDAYNGPILKNARLVFERLKKGGHYCVVVGDAILRGELVKMNANFDSLFTSVGFKKIREIQFPQRKYTKTFTPGMREANKTSYVLIYRRVK